MKHGALSTVLLLVLSVVLAGCLAYPYNHYQRGEGYYYYGPDTQNPTYFGPL